MKLASAIFINSWLQFWDLHSLKLPPKTLRYISHETFNKQNLIRELDQKLIKGDNHKTDDSYSKLTEIFLDVLEETKHLLRLRNSTKSLWINQECKIDI